MSFWSHASGEFWDSYLALPERIRRQADKAYERFSSNPSHPSLCLKRVGPFWSARVSLEYRVLAYREGNEFFWFWIGPHDEYDRIISG